MEKKKCKVDNDHCNGPSYGWGYCPRHYGRAKRGGDPYAPFPSEYNRTCKISDENCNQYYAKGYCALHYDRQVRGRDVKAPAQSSNKGKKCAHTGCRRDARIKGHCAGHRKQYMDTGETWDFGAVKSTSTFSQCRRSGCTDTPFKSSLCETHFNERQDWIDKTGRRCSVNNCIGSAAGENILCASHKKIASKYFPTPEAYAAFRAEHPACDLCGADIRLAVDHDHSCCPGGETCGNCIRGLLCYGCNVGIGNLRDNPALLRKAAEYIEANSKPA